MFPHINGRNDRGPAKGGLGAFYARSGLDPNVGRQAGLPPQPLGNRRMAPPGLPRVGQNAAPDSSGQAGVLAMQAQMMQQRRRNMQLKAAVAQRNRQAAAYQQQQRQQQQYGNGDMNLMGQQGPQAGGDNDDDVNLIRGPAVDQQQQRQQQQQQQQQNEPTTAEKGMEARMKLMENMLKEHNEKLDTKKSKKNKNQEVEEEEEEEEEEDSEDEEEKKKRKRKEKENLTPDIIQKLEKLNKEIDDASVEAQKNLLDIEKSYNERKDEATQLAKEAMRERYKSRLDAFDLGATGLIKKMPRWRHQMNGVDTNIIDQSKILKGAALWRTVAWGMIVMYVRPWLAIKNRKKQRYEEESKDSRLTLEDFLDPICLWFGKNLKIPIDSLMLDTSLALRPVRQRTLLKETYSMKKEAKLQLKVRLMAILKAVKNSDLPEYDWENEEEAKKSIDSKLLKFLVTLISDEFYFYDGFLYNNETRIMEFDELGATKNVVQRVDEQDADLGKPLVKGQFILGTEVKKRKVDASRARLLLGNFMFIRIFLEHVLLSPWNYHLCSRPKGLDSTLIVNNFRALATIFYMILHYMDPSLPPLNPVLDPDLVHKYSSEEEMLKFVKKEDEDNNSTKVSNKEDGDDKDDEDDKDDDVDDNTEDANGQKKYVEGTFMHFLFAKPEYDPKDKKNSGRKKPKTHEEYIKEDLLGNNRHQYEGLQWIMNYLIDPREFACIKRELDEWIPIGAEILDDYLNRLLQHILESRDVNRLHHEHIEHEKEEAEKKAEVERAAAIERGSVTDGSVVGDNVAAQNNPDSNTNAAADSLTKVDANRKAMATNVNGGSGASTPVKPQQTNMVPSTPTGNRAASRLSQRAGSRASSRLNIHRPTQDDVMRHIASPSNPNR